MAHNQLKILSTRSKLANHNKRPREGGYYTTLLLQKNWDFTQKKTFLVSEVAILDKPYNGVKCR